ncbi:MAG: hypothetical protein WKG01_24515 [Kofleriaceae bacterium]
MRNTFVLIALGLSLFACRSSGGGDDDDDDDDQPDAPLAGVSIQEIQNDNMAAGTPVDVHGVVVVAIDKYGMRTSDIYVMEPEGGELSGVHVFGAPVDKVAALAVGDIISITGAEKDEFALTSDTSGRTITELKPVSGGAMDIVKTGTGSVPEPKVIDALAIGQMATQAERDAEWEKWEGVLVTVNNVRAFNSPNKISKSDATLLTVDMTGGLVLESAVSAFPAGVTRDACLASATGIVDYFFDYLLYPRSSADVVTGGSACAPPEATTTVCGDDIDNDGNGFKDCEDNACIVGEATCRAVTTISAIQAATPTGGIELADVYITGVSRPVTDQGSKNFWVSTSLTAAPNQGIYIRGNGADLPATFVVGAKVGVIGKAKEYNNDAMGETLTQVEALAWSLTTAGPATTFPVDDKLAAVLTQAATGEPYESVLVTLKDVKVTMVGTEPKFYVSTGVQGATTFLIDDDALRLEAGDLNKCFTFTGLWTYQVFDNKYGLLPTTKTVTPCP